MGCKPSNKKIKVIAIQNQSPLNETKDDRTNENKNNESPVIEVKKKYETNKIKSLNYFEKITPKNITRILDFLNFKELTQAGMLNSSFHKLAVNPKLLVKFFVKRSN